MSTVGIDAIQIPVADPRSAAAFYREVFGADSQDVPAPTVSLHGLGALEFVAAPEEAEAQFERIVLTYILEQPSQVRAMVDAAVSQGARALKPAKKALFGAYSGVIRAPDGLIWKIASAQAKDSPAAGADSPAAGAAPGPKEATVILGVRDPNTSREFYSALGMRTDRDYGSKYIDFHPAREGMRLCLMQSPVLAKDVGSADATEAPGIALVHRGAPSSGITDPQRALTDPDGFRWLFTVH